MSSPTRREFLKTVGFAAVTTGTLSVLPSYAGASQAAADQSKQPNVIRRSSSISDVFHLTKCSGAGGSTMAIGTNVSSIRNS